MAELMSRSSAVRLLLAVNGKVSGAESSDEPPAHGIARPKCRGRYPNGASNEGCGGVNHEAP